MERFHCIRIKQMIIHDDTYDDTYSGTSLLRTPWDLHYMSLLQRCPVLIHNSTTPEHRMVSSM